MRSMRLLPWWTVLLVFCSAIFAQETIKNVVIEGNQRFSRETILNYASVEEGDTFEEAETSQIISNLFVTDFFDNIEVDFNTSNQVLTIKIQEKPVLGEVTFKGNYHFSDNDIEKSLTEYNIDVGRTFNQRKLANMIRELVVNYNADGYYEAAITYTLADLENGAKCLNLQIDEGETAKVFQINFYGNHSYPADLLLWQMSLQPTNFFTMLTSADKYGEYKLEHDCYALTHFYHNEGYPEMRIVDKKISLTSEKKGIIIDIFIDEGEKEMLTDLQIILPEGIEIGELEEMSLPCAWKKDLINSYEQDIRDALNINGYVYGEIKQERESIAPGESRLIYRVFPGEKYRIGTYNFRGNTMTNERILRNFVARPEGSYYSSSDIRELNDDLSRIGIFSDVQVNPVRKNSKEVDIDVSVTEDKTKKFFAMGGVSTIDTGFSWAIGYEDRNILGSGMKTSLKFEADNFENVFQFTLINPYLTYDNLEGFFSIEKIQRSYKNDYMFFKQDRNIFSTSAGLAWPLTKTVRASLSTNYFAEKDKNEEQALMNGEDPWAHYVFVTVRLNENKMNRYMMPDRGYYWECSSQVSTPLGDYTYTDNNIRIQKYTPLWKSGYILYNAVSFRGMYPFGNPPRNEIPSTRLLYCGGISDIRGYHFSSVGPELRQEIDGEFEYKTVGGNVKFTSRNELIVPNDVLKIPFNQIRVSLFIDAAQLWRTDSIGIPESYKQPPFTYLPAEGIKVSGGLCVRFVSQILPPITISLNHPLTWEKKDEKKYEYVSFSTQVEF